MPHNGDSERFNRVNGARVRDLRKARGWTQLALATRAGYSERVIRKAEGGEAIRHDVLVSLAQALSTPEELITVATLVADPLPLVRKFFETYDRYERDMLPHLTDVLSPDIRFIFHADPARNPLSGTWEGFSGLQAYLDKFFGMFVRCNPEKLAPRYSVNGDQVVVSYSEIVRFGEVVAPPVWIHLIFTIREARIIQVEDFCDTDTAARFLKDVGVTGETPDSPPE